MPGWKALTVSTCLGMLTAAVSPAAEPRIDTILYGASYYHEYMPEERLEKDVRLMEEAGVSVVRLGESTWSSWEPRDGHFETAWMKRILDRLHEAGIQVVLGTPTYSIPPWLYARHPEITVIPLGQLRTPHEFYGPRQNMDITHPTYRYYAERVIRTVASAFADHPAVIGFQVDNETSHYGTAGPAVQSRFAEYLREKYGDVERLNEVWGLAYWGQRLGSWEELPPRDGALNPGYKVEWQRFWRKIVTEFLAWQAAIVREYARPDQFVTQNFNGGVLTDRDQEAIAREMDVCAINPYHPVQDELDGHGIALSGDICRSTRSQSYLVTETNAQTIGWRSSSYQYPPWDGQLRLNVYGHVASGAEMVAYWHWHSLHYGNETYWKGVLGHDLEPNRVYREMARVGAELKRVGPQLANLEKRNRVAILYSIDSYHGLEAMPFNKAAGWPQFDPAESGTDYMTILHQVHRALYDLNVETDFAFPDSDLSRWDVLLVPPLYVASDALLERLVAYVMEGGHLLLTFKSGFTDEHSRVRWIRAPGPLREAAGFSYQEFSSLRSPLPLKGDPFDVGDEANQASIWMEMLQLEGAEALAFYDHHFFGDYPAISRNRFGEGTLTYEGTVLSDGLQRAVILDVLELAGLTGPDQELPAAIRIRGGVGASGKAQRYYLNYSGTEQSFVYPYASGRDLLTGRIVAEGEEVALAPWDLVIVEER